MSTTTLRPPRTRPITLTTGGHLHDAPDATVITPAMLAGWTRHGVALRYCQPDTGPCAHPWDGRCIGHHDPHVAPGHRLVVGRPGRPDPGHGRAVYRVAAVGSAGIRLVREA